MLPIAPRILFIDSYDSFTHNLTHLIRSTIPNSQIHLIHNDTLTISRLLPFLSCFHAIIIGPGPGSPINSSDVGIIPALWALKDEDLLPIFGVCLGFQSLGLACGGEVKRMNVVKHGMISRVEHTSKDLFEGVRSDMEATRYHSLCVDAENAVDFEPLAWSDDKFENGKVLMGGRHRTKPFWGVQYHPESICTKGGGGEVIRNFWRMACQWTERRQRSVHGLPLPPWMPEALKKTWPQTRDILNEVIPTKGLTVSYTTVVFPNMPIPQVCDLLGVQNPHSDFVMLDSAAKSGRFTIIGALKHDTLSVRYTIPDNRIVLRRGTDKPTHEVLPTGTPIWAWLARFMHERTVTQGGNEEVPFWGGFIGYLSYELGVVELDVALKHREGKQGKVRNPDVNLVFVERSVVFDAEKAVAYVQSIREDDDEWIGDTKRRLEEMCLGAGPRAGSTLPKVNGAAVQSGYSSSCISAELISPSQEAYVPRVEECKYHLSVGSSYELCLTAQSTLRIPVPSSPLCSHGPTSWFLYKRLRASNPAPHAAYLRLGPTTVLCSSPERFLRWDRAGRCELRPIKGTLRKVFINTEGKKVHMGREDAEELLGRNVKERAENLMIVDLVRHDLGGVVDDDDGVKVDKLMGIEEFETVWQMVSVISGRVSGLGGGWEVLRRSLPPGSMTGAPKKRSVELLQDIEGEERGIYSGVLGYWCVGGGGDWAVVIRTCFRYEVHEKEVHLNGGHHAEEWTLGAGGAITALSDPVSEWEEMKVKLSSVGRAFGLDE